MSNITMSIEEKLLTKAKKIAVEKNKSLTQMIREFLLKMVLKEETKKNHHIRELAKLFSSSSAKVGSKRWKREDLYAR